MTEVVGKSKGKKNPFTSETDQISIWSSASLSIFAVQKRFSHSFCHFPPCMCTLYGGIYWRHLKAFQENARRFTQTQTPQKTKSNNNIEYQPALFWNDYSLWCLKGLLLPPPPPHIRNIRHVSVLCCVVMWLAAFPSLFPFLSIACVWWMESFCGFWMVNWLVHYKTASGFLTFECCLSFCV